MSWVRGIPINAGILAGDVFQRVDTDMNLESWSVAPDIQSSILKYVQGGGQRWQSISISGLVRGQEDGTRILYAAIDIEPSESSPYIHGQIRIDIEKAGGGCGIFVYYRVWTDESTYNDLSITSTASLTIAPVDVQRDDDIWLFFTLSNYQGESMIIVGYCGSYDLGGGREYPMEAYTMSYFDFIGNIILGTLPDEESSPEYGDASDVGGGYNEDAEHGSFDDTSDTIPIPTRPTLSPLSAGYFHAYYLSDPAVMLRNVGDALFPEDPTQQGDIFSAIDEVAQMLFYNKQIDFVVDCHVIPCIPEHGANAPIRVGGRILTKEDAGQAVQLVAPAVTDGYVEYDCGKIQIKEYWKNFLDFSNGTRAKLFLPFVGFVDLLPEFFNGGELGIIYRFNVVDGSFMVYITSSSSKSELKDSMIAQYSGNACMHIPLQSADYSRILGGIVSAVTTVAGASTGNMAVAGAGLTGAYTNLAGARPQMNSSNGYAASAAYMSKRTPYLIIERAKSQFSKNYPNEIGLPLNVTRTLSSVHGFTIIENPVLNIDCNDNEYNELVNLLKSGVIF